MKNITTKCMTCKNYGHVEICEDCEKTDKYEAIELSDSTINTILEIEEVLFRSKTKWQIEYNPKTKTYNITVKG